MPLGFSSSSVLNYRGIKWNSISPDWCCRSESKLCSAQTDGRQAQFVIAPLERGFGHTLGNTSAPHPAVVAARLGGLGVPHRRRGARAPDDPGVVEDVHQIIQNLKTLVLRSRSRRGRGGARAARQPGGPGHARAISNVGCARSSIPTTTCSRSRTTATSTSSLREQGPRLRARRAAPVAAGRPVDLVRVDAIYNPVPRANFTSRDARGPAHRLRPPDCWSRPTEAFRRRESVGYAAGAGAQVISSTCCASRSHSTPAAGAGRGPRSFAAAGSVPSADRRAGRA